ncbi:MAG: hypothetical protein ACP5G0_08600 [Desulfomonilia bacterium]
MRLVVIQPWGETFMQIYEPIKASRRLSGTAYTRSAHGSTLRFQVTTHIKTKAINQLISAVCMRLNLLEMKYIPAANKNPHATHIIAFRT